MKYQIADVTVRDGPYGTAIISRRSLITNKYSTMIVHGAAAVHIAQWLTLRKDGKPAPLVQEAFPRLSADEREFIISGITPEEWDQAFPDNEEIGE